MATTPIRRRIDPLSTDTSYYDKAIADYNQTVDTDTASQIKKAEDTASLQLRQAYISNLQNRNALRDNLARSGVRGGASETANLRLMSNYGNTRSGINSNLANTTMELNRNATNRKAENTASVNAARQEYLDNTRQAQWQADREDTAALNEQDRNIKLERLTAKYSAVYSDSELKKALAATTDEDEKAIINTRIGYLLKAKKNY